MDFKAHTRDTSSTKQKSPEQSPRKRDFAMPPPPSDKATTKDSLDKKEVQNTSDTSANTTHASHIPVENADQMSISTESGNTLKSQYDNIGMRKILRGIGSSDTSNKRMDTMNDLAESIRNKLDLSQTPSHESQQQKKSFERLGTLLDVLNDHDQLKKLYTSVRSKLHKALGSTDKQANKKIEDAIEEGEKAITECAEIMHGMIRSAKTILARTLSRENKYLSTEQYNKEDIDLPLMQRHISSYKYIQKVLSYEENLYRIFDNKSKAIHNFEELRTTLDTKSQLQRVVDLFCRETGYDSQQIITTKESQFEPIQRADTKSTNFTALSEFRDQVRDTASSLTFLRELQADLLPGFQPDRLLATTLEHHDQIQSIHTEVEEEFSRRVAEIKPELTRISAQILEDMQSIEKNITNIADQLSKSKMPAVPEDSAISFVTRIDQYKNTVRFFLEQQAQEDKLLATDEETRLYKTAIGIDECFKTIRKTAKRIKDNFLHLSTQTSFTNIDNELADIQQHHDRLYKRDNISHLRRVQKRSDIYQDWKDQEQETDKLRSIYQLEAWLEQHTGLTMPFSTQKRAMEALGERLANALRADVSKSRKIYHENLSRLEEPLQDESNGTFTRFVDRYNLLKDYELTFRAIDDNQQLFAPEYTDTVKTEIEQGTQWLKDNVTEVLTPFKNISSPADLVTRITSLKNRYKTDFETSVYDDHDEYITLKMEYERLKQVRTVCSFFPQDTSPESVEHFRRILGTDIEERLQAIKGLLDGELSLLSTPPEKE